MFTVENSLFTQIMLKHFDFYQKDVLLDPTATKTVLYMFNQTRNKSKYHIMTYYVYDSRFVVRNVKIDLRFLFCYSQITYNAFTRLAILWKQKRLTSSITTDLMLIPLDTYKPSTIVTLYEHGKPYPFHLPNLYNIILEALSHCSHDYFLEIKPIKNPYTNLPFKLHNIYNIFLAYQESTYTMPSLFRAYIECNCDVKAFMNSYEPIIRDYCIDKYFATISNYKCLKEIRRMLRDDLIKKITSMYALRIDERFPWENLMYHFKPFAKLHHKVKYGLNPYSKYSNKTILIKKLKLFMQENPYYGRKFVYSNRTETNLFVFGSQPRNPFDTSVNTHFNDMTHEQLKGISSYIRNGRYRQERTVDITVGARALSDMISESEMDSEIDSEEEDPQLYYQ